MTEYSFATSKKAISAGTESLPIIAAVVDLTVHSLKRSYVRCLLAALYNPEFEPISKRILEGQCVPWEYELGTSIQKVTCLL